MTGKWLPTDAPPGRYTIERTLGHGGMATVYLARDQFLDRLVALKVLAAHLAHDDVFRDRFLREARLAARLVHPNVVRVYDVGEDERGPFIVMEYVDDGTLYDELQRRGRLPAAEVVAIGVQVCSALEAAHGEQLVHRDIKPQNILRRPDGHVKIADFGIARSLAGTHHTEIGAVLGTAAYLAPEQARGEPVTAAADVYSLGVVLYELLTGQTPFTGDTLSELVLKRAQGAITSPRELVPDLPPALDVTVMRCLAPQPADRYASAAVLAQALAASSDEPATELLLIGTDLRATEVMPSTRAARSRWRRALDLPRRRLLVAVVTAAALVALTVILVGALADSSTRSPIKAATPPATTAAATSAAATNRLPTAQQEIARARVAITRTQADGQIDPSAVGGLNNQLDAIAQTLAADNSQAAALQTDALLQQLSNLVQQGQLNTAGLTRISGPLRQLTALLPAVQPVNTPPAKGHDKGHGHGNKGDG